MNSGRTWAVTLRVVQQFRRDRRTLTMVLLVPVVMMTLVGYLVEHQHPERTVAIVDNTGLGLALLVAPQIEQGGKADIYSTDEATARRELRDGNAQAALLFSGTLPAIEARLVLEGTEPSNAQAIRQLVSGAVLALRVEAGGGLPAAPADIPTEYVYGGPDYNTLDFFAPALMAFFAFFLVFLLTAVSFQRERSAGTLERLMASPLRRRELIGGYMLGFGFFALLQAVLVVLVAVLILRIHHAGALAWVFLVVILLSLAAVNLGIFVSAFARTELQAVQFIPLVIVPQALLSGVIWPLSSLPGVFEPVARLFPMTYAIAALRGVMLKGQGIENAGLLGDCGVVFGFAVLFAALAVGSLRREVA